MSYFISVDCCSITNVLIYIVTFHFCNYVSWFLIIDMLPQIALMNGCIVTPITFVWHFSSVFSNVSSNCLHERMHTHTGCICLTFLHCAFSNVSSNGLYEQMHSHIGCIYSSFLHCVFSNVPTKHLHRRMQSHTGCICSFSLLRFKISPQHVCTRRCIVTLVAFVWLFATVRFQMSP